MKTYSSRETEKRNTGATGHGWARAAAADVDTRTYARHDGRYYTATNWFFTPATIRRRVNKKNNDQCTQTDNDAACGEVAAALVTMAVEKAAGAER